MVSPPRCTSSNLPFSIWRTSSGSSNRLMIRSSMWGSFLARTIRGPDYLRTLPIRGRRPPCAKRFPGAVRLPEQVLVVARHEIVRKRAHELISESLIEPASFAVERGDTQENVRALLPESFFRTLDQPS